MFRLHERLRMAAGAMVANGFFHGAAAAGRLHPMARPRRHRVEVIRDVRYQEGTSRAHLLDIYRPTTPPADGRGHPIVLYIHGGAFRMLSKDTHWLMGLAFARRGYLVFNINYRLAPNHPYPAAIRDACAAWCWVVENCARYGGDPSRIVVAGACLLHAVGTSNVLKRRFQVRFAIW